MGKLSRHVTGDKGTNGMAIIGIALSCEERPARELVEAGRAAEAAGFSAGWISDHFHPWNDEQGESPFVWSVLGALGEVTSAMSWETAVTCPTVRTHPAIVAQAAATTATLMPGRFRLGVGSGEALNEHIFGDAWPRPAIRLEMLEEAIEMIRLLWSGEVVSHRGRHYTLDRARIYSLPDELPPSSSRRSIAEALELAARTGDGFATTKPDAEAHRPLPRTRRQGPHPGRAQVLLRARRARTPSRRRIASGRTSPSAGSLAQMLPHAGATSRPPPS